MEKLFVYGTLRIPDIRNRIAGRKIPSVGNDSLTGYKLSTVGDNHQTYPILIADPGNNFEIEGEILEVTEADLIRIDEYEGDLYTRQKVLLSSGTGAWVYTQ